MNQSRKGLCLLELSSESDSDCAAEEDLLMYLVASKKMKSPNNFYLCKRKTHGQFKMTSELPDALYTNYFRMTRNQFAEVHGMIQQSIFSDGCNAKEPIGTEEKLGVFLR